MFTLFGNLAPELRIQIWKAALPGPRVINIKEHLVGKPNDVNGDRSLSSDSNAPSILFVCRESRLVALQFYVPSFTFADSVPRTYFNFSIDVLYLRFDEYIIDLNDDTESADSFGSVSIDVDVRFENFLDALHDVVDLRRVQKLALLLNWEDANCHQQLAQVLGWFGHIRELIVVVGHFGAQGDIMFYEPLDITKTCHNYATFSRELSYIETPEVPLAVDFVSTIDLERELKDLHSYERGDRGNIPVPRIAYKSAVKYGLEQRLADLRKVYQEKLQRLFISLNTLLQLVSQDSKNPISAGGD